MNKKGKAVSTGMVYFFAIALVVIIGLGAYAMFGRTSQTGIGATGAVITSLTPTEQAQAITQCGSTKQTAVTATLKNGLNTTASQTFDATYYLYQITDKGETQVQTGSDTTAGAITVDCGSKYRLKLVADATTNSRITSVYTNNAQVDADGSVVFTTTSPSLTLGMVSSKHNAMQVRAYNEDSRARMFSTLGSSSDYMDSGVLFWSTTNNATRTTVTAGSSMLMTVEMQNPNTVADFNDYGTYVMFDASPSYWDKVQRVTFDGTELQDVKGQLNSDESKAFSGYEFVYFIPAGKLVDSKNHRLYFEITKSSGATGNDDLLVDYAVKGNYLSVDGFSIKTAGAKDTASSPVVFSKFTTTFKVQ